MMLSWFRTWLQGVFIGVIFAWAGINLLLHASLYWLEHNPNILSQWASDKLGTPISIQRLESRWQRFTPLVQLYNVHIGPDGQRSQLAKVSLAITWQGLRVGVEQLKLKLLRSQNGQIRIEGLPQTGHRNNNSPGLPFKQLWLSNSQLEWHDQQLNLAPIQFQQVEALLHQQHGTLHIRSQGNFQSTHHAQWQGQFTLNAIKNQGWEIQLQTPQFGRLAARIMPTTKQSTHVQLGAESIDIALLHGALAPILNNPALHDTLQGIQPTGRLQQVRLQADLGKQIHWTLNTQLHQLSIQAWQSIPGINKLNGYLRAQSDRASIQLHGQDLTLDYPQLFRQPLTISDFNSRLHWLTNQHGEWLLHSNKIQLKTPHLQAASRLQIQQNNQQATHIELQTLLQQAQVSALSHYLPAHIMDEALVTWMDNAFSQGSLEKAQILLSGPLDTFPYNKVRNGTFEAIAIAHNTPLAYQPGWPNLQAKEAQLHFHENSLDITLGKGRIYNSSITQAHAQIASLGPTTTPVHIQGKVEGPLANVIQLLQEDALRPKFGEMANNLKANGQSSLSLALSIPLQDGVGNYALNGKLAFHQAELALPEWNLTLDDIQGTLNIDLTKLHAEGIKANALGSPISLDVLPHPEHTLVHAEGQFTSAALARQFPQIPLYKVSGKSNYHVTVHIPNSSNTQAHSQLQVYSDLLGSKIDLPAPLGKTANNNQLLYINLPLDNKRNAVNHIRYGKHLDARFSPDWSSGTLHYATGIAPFPDTPGYQINAALQQLDLAAWQKVLAQLAPNTSSSPPWQASIRAGQLTYNSLMLDQAQAALYNDSKTLKGSLNSKQLIGKLAYAKPDAKLTLALEHAHLDLSTESSTSNLRKNGPDPRQWPALDLRCDDLQINQAKLGRLSVSSRKTAKGLDIQHIQLQGQGLSLKAQGQWQQKTQAHSNLQGNLQVGDLGQLLHDLGFERHMQDAEANLDFNLNWPGHPLQAHKASLLGSLNLDIKDGRLAEIEPGLMRVLSLLSLDALARRLRFDFTDMLYEGYAFDHMHGQFTFKAGLAHTDNFSVTAASADLEMGGNIGLVDKDFKQLVVHATPKLDAVLPIIGVATGGPVGGIAAFILQQALAKQIDGISRFEYSVTGSWDEPVITPLESGGALSDLANSIGGENVQNKTQEQQELLKPRERKNLLERIFNTKPNQEDTTEPDDYADLYQH